MRGDAMGPTALNPDGTLRKPRDGQRALPGADRRSAPPAQQSRRDVQPPRGGTAQDYIDTTARHAGDDEELDF
jgi:hypothetical protein